MMAKMFYTLDEAKAALGKSEDEIKQYSKEGRLREFRDGQRLMFKADQVEQLRTELTTGGTAADLGPSDSASGVNLADNAPPSGSGMVSLADTDFGKSAAGIGEGKEDTHLSEDLGLSGSIGGIPSPTAKSTGSGVGSPTTGSKAGITVFDVDDAHRADPSAQTATGSGSGIHEPPLEGVGSGSGLLDLARDRDDTSLGAEVLDEISPAGGGGGGRRPSPVSSGDSAVDLEAAFEPQGRGGITRSTLAAPVYVEVPDPMATAFGALALFGAIIVVFGMYVMVNAVLGVHPDMIKDLSGGPNSKGTLYMIGAVVGAVIFFAIGWFFGKATPNRR
jgi:hypothetical protein